MKHTKYILPIVLLMSLASCGGANIVDRATEKGSVPEGGARLEGKETKLKALAKTLKVSKNNLEELDEFGMKATCEGVDLELASTYLNGTLSLGAFSFTAGATNLVSGDKETTKVGVDFSGLKSTANLKSANNPAADDFDFIQENTIGKCGAYLDNGNIYLNLEGLGVPETINKAATIAEPYLPTVIALADIDKDLGTVITYFVSQFAVSPENVTKTISPFFGKFNPNDFNYKFAVKNKLQDADYPLLSEDKFVSDDNFDNTALELANSFDEVTGLDFNNDLDMYSYDDGGLAISLSLGKDKIAKYLDKHIKTVDFDYTINDGTLNLALYINGKGIPTSFSVVNNMDLTLTGDECDRRFGGDLAVKESSDFNLNLSTDSNPVAFPESYSDYNDITFVGTVLSFIA